MFEKQLSYSISYFDLKVSIMGTGNVDVGFFEYSVDRCKYTNSCHAFCRFK